MIPARFVHMERFPINSAGKVDLQSLRLPEARFAPYVPPVTEVEKVLCRVMAQVLETELFSLPGLISLYRGLHSECVWCITVREKQSPDFGKEVRR